jgi:quercetin dioxygenase-like cupin family protein
MLVRHKAAADQRERNGLISHFMLGRGDGVDALAVTWVDVAPGSYQKIHHHPEVQVYVIVAGTGMMHVGEAEQQVSAGDLIFIPSDVPHGITNNGAGSLSYISAATPAFDLEEAYDRGQLTPEAYQTRE